MKFLKGTFFSALLFVSVNLIAQDGSNIRYVYINKVDSTFIGKFIHLDFYNRSFKGFNLNKKELNDTITIKLNNIKALFREHRVDNGFNNWFSEQYIESTKFINNYKIRISKCKLEEVKANSIVVTLFIEYRNKKGELNTKKSNTITSHFPKDILAQILVKVNNK